MKRHISAGRDSVRVALGKLGYVEIRGNHFKRGRFHVILHTDNPSRIYVSLHLDFPQKPWRRLKHRTIENDSRLDEEFRKIKEICEK